jgi:hypothetical protein
VKTFSQQLTKNKSIEFNLYKTGTILGIEFDLTTRQDHAGLRLMLGLLSWQVELQVYDARHWNSLTEDWENYD